MAIFDYGSIVKINNKLVQNDMFMDMKKAVGYSIEHVTDLYGTKMRINESFFSYEGRKYKKYTHKEKINDVNLTIKRIKRNQQGINRYKLRFWYKNNLYEAIYGYGVDLDINLWYDLTNRERHYLIKKYFTNLL